MSTLTTKMKLLNKAYENLNAITQDEGILEIVAIIVELEIEIERESNE